MAVARVRASRTSELGRIVLALGVVVLIVGLTSTRASALSTGTITTVAGTGAPGFGPWPGPGTSGALNNPDGVVFDPVGAPSVFIADTSNCEVLQEDVATQTVTPVVNISSVCGTPPGTFPVPASSAQLDHPFGLAIDATHHLLYVADRDNHGIAVIDIAASPALYVQFIPIVPGALVSLPVGVAVDQGTGDLYIADQGTNVVWRNPFGAVNPAVVAGVFNTPGFNGNGIPATTALLNDPSDVDFVGKSLYIADTGNNEVRSVNGGSIYDEVGSPSALSGFSPDGSPANSPIAAPTAVRVDGGGTVFFDEDGPSLVRDIKGTGGTLDTVAGTAGGTPFPYSGDPATSVALHHPNGLAFVPDTAAAADLWFSDDGNEVVDAVTGVASAAGFSSSPRITSANSALAEVGHPFTFTVATTGTPIPKLKGKGKLPKGLKFVDNGDGTGTISGTPTSTKHKSALGAHTITLRATFGKGHDKVVSTQTWTLDVYP